MCIYFLSRQPDVCQLLADELVKVDAEVKIFPLIPELLHTVIDLGNVPDILFLDFLYYQSEFFDFYNLLEKHQKIFPIVYYNHPFPIPEKRKFFWKFNLQQTGYFSDLTKLEPILEIMEQALKDQNIAPYVSCIQNPTPYKSKNLRYIEPLPESQINFYLNNFNNVITDSLKGSDFSNSVYQKSKNLETDESLSDNIFTTNFRNKHHLSHKIFNLFRYLYIKRNNHVSCEELSKILSKDKEEISPNGIRLAIHRLRAILKKDLTVGLEILNYDYGYSMIEKNTVEKTD